MAEFITDQLNSGNTPEQATNALYFAAWSALVACVEAPLTHAAKYGAEEIVASIGVDLPDSAPEIDSWKIAQNYARERGAEMVGMKWVDDELVPNPDAKWQITEGTRDMLRSTVERGIKEGLTTDELKQSIMDSHSFSERRANMIARTEIRMARAAGSYDAAVGLGCTHKYWTTAKDDKVSPECRANGLQEPILISEPFASGDMRNPAHPHCRCVVNYLFSDSKDAVAKGFNPNQPRDAHGRWGSGSAISGLADAARSDHSKNATHDLGTVSAGNASAVHKDTGHDISGFRREADDGHLRHVFVSHGNESRESMRGQRAVETADLKRLPSITDKPSSVSLSTKTNRGSPVIEYRKTFGKEEFVYAEAIRSKTYRVAFLSLRINVKK